MEIAHLADHRHFIPLIVELTFAEWGHLYGALNLTPELARKTFEERAVKGRVPFTLVAIESGAFIGTASVKLHEHNTDDALSPWLAAVLVKPEYRGRGIARALIKFAEGVCSELGVATLYLATEADEEQMYAHLGWTVIDRLKSIGDGVATMKKNLLSH